MRKGYYENGVFVEIGERTLEDYTNDFKAHIDLMLCENPDTDHIELISRFRKVLNEEEKWYRDNQQLVEQSRKEKREKEAEKGVVYEQQ